MKNTKTISIIGLAGFPSVKRGDNLAELIIKTAQKQGVSMDDGDILVVAQKIVSKAEGRVFQLKSVKPSERAKKLARITLKDPKFVDVAAHDFHLQKNSPCIDAGDPDTDPGYDLDGMYKPRDGDGDGAPIVDMGAYEYPGPGPPIEEVEVRNRPNPFRAGKEETLIEYNLKQPSNVTITIYDLLGQQVWRKSYRAGENGGREVNSVPWDGRNLSGEVVGNGGYFCHIWVEKEKRHMLRKIAVAK